MIARKCRGGPAKMRFVKKVNERGVVTLPTEVREALGVEEGDIVEFEVLGIARKANSPTPTPKIAPEGRLKSAKDLKTNMGGDE